MLMAMPSETEVTQDPAQLQPETGAPPRTRDSTASLPADVSAIHEDVERPLAVSVNRWVPPSLAPEMLDRRVTGLLNKLTSKNFEPIFTEIIAWANRSEQERDGHTFIRVVSLVFTHATNDALCSEMYARLCRHMQEQISPKIRDDGARDSQGKHISGGHLFRKYLLTLCQEAERRWTSTWGTVTTSSQYNESLNPAEDDLAQKVKRRQSNLVRFTCELFKLGVFTERIIHERIKNFLANVESPEEEQIESLCLLLATVGGLLDSPKARAHIDVYFSRIRQLTKNPNVNLRLQFMLQDIIELRDRKWAPRHVAPVTVD